MKPPKYPTNRQKLKLGVAPKPVPSVTPAPSSCEDQSKAGPFSSSSQSDQSTISFSSVSNAIPTNSKEVEKILRAIYNGKPIEEAEDSSEQVSEICKRISPTNSVEVNVFFFFYFAGLVLDFLFINSCILKNEVLPAHYDSTEELF